MLLRVKYPLLTKLLRYVMSDEARHVAFGVLTLSEYYGDLSEAELKERQEFLVGATLNSRSRATTPEVWERMGTTAEEVFPFIMQAAEKAKLNPMRGFARGFFAKLVPNGRKLGLLDANDGYLRERWGEAGLLEFGSADDTGSDILRRRGGPGGCGGDRRPGVSGGPFPISWRAIARSPKPRSFFPARRICPAFRSGKLVMTSEDGTSMTMKAPGAAGPGWPPSPRFCAQYVGPKGLGRRAPDSGPL
jgi:hypothetical protein